MRVADDAFDLQRFVDAQAPVIEQVHAELAAGRKTSHWMWFVFPQLRGLGHSATAVHYGVASLGEAQAYLRHPVLGARLRECAALVLATRGRSAHEIFGSPDDRKLQSSMTLFAHAAPDEALFRDVLARYYGGREDATTVASLAGASP
jgi:uncharacterized protein (DUF1810 family)